MFLPFVTKYLKEDSLVSIVALVKMAEALLMQQPFLGSTLGFTFKNYINYIIPESVKLFRDIIFLLINIFWGGDCIMNKNCRIILNQMDVT